MTKILVTGAAGFIGFHLSLKLIGEGYDVTGLDNINSYYDPAIKYDRLKILGVDKDSIAEGVITTSAKYPNFRFIKTGLENAAELKSLFATAGYDVVCHLAAQAGVRYSLENPYAYIDSNVTGFLNIAECCRHHMPKHLVYASSSSVYGLNGAMPLSTGQGIAHPVSMYAATKKSNELMAHTYSHLFGIPTTGLRFFTVYGPWGRPDMALFLFTKAILENKPIDVFNHGDMLRDFTYIDDIVTGISLVLKKAPVANPGWDPATADPATSSAPYRIYNIGNSNPVKLMDFIHAIEEMLGRKTEMNMMPLQPGDVQRTFSDVSALTLDTGYKPQTNVKEGISRFVEWYLDYFKIDH